MSIKGTWTFPEYITYTNFTSAIGKDTRTFYINFVSNGVSYSSITLKSYVNTTGWTIKYGTTEVYTCNIGLHHSWADESYKSMTITGGEDIENETLVSWVEASGTKVKELEEEPEKEETTTPTRSTNMNLKAIIPSGQTEITVNGLHQWDYGRKLEIHSAELPALIEVHFACSGMTEAVVRSCAVVDGVATADIPDHCIEQTTPIVAWIYCIDDTSGKTERTIIMPIIARTKPAPSPSVPTAVSDKYTELIGAVNEQIGALQDGTVTAAKAEEANHAAAADSATTAGTAGHATSAGHANTAGTAGHATTAGSAEVASSLGLAPVVEVEITGGEARIAEADATLLKNTVLVTVLDVPSTNVEGKRSIYTGVTYFQDDVNIDDTPQPDHPVTQYSGDCGTYSIVYYPGAYYTDNNLTIYDRDGNSATVNGTLKFYKLGGISE